MDVVALGELLIDFTENGVSSQGNPLFEANPGGAPCNVLAMLSRLGHKTAFIGKVGNDFFGKQLEDAIKEVGIDARGLRKDDEVHDLVPVRAAGRADARDLLACVHAVCIRLIDTARLRGIFYIAICAAVVYNEQKLRRRADAPVCGDLPHTGAFCPRSPEKTVKWKVISCWKQSIRSICRKKHTMRSRTRSARERSCPETF